MLSPSACFQWQGGQAPAEPGLSPSQPKAADGLQPLKPLKPLNTQQVLGAALGTLSLSGTDSATLGSLVISQDREC